MFTADQLVAHAVGDYLLQSEWMAQEKTRQTRAALVHAAFYVLPFLFLTLDPVTLLVIGSTHFVMDRWHLARIVIWAKNRPWPGSRPWSECRQTGFPPETPDYIARWLLIIVDNILHVIANALALYYLG